MPSNQAPEWYSSALVQTPRSLPDGLLDSITLPTRELVKQTLFGWGMEMLPKEACGLIVDDGHGGYEVHHLLNTAPEPATGYRIDPSIVGMVVANKAVWNNSTVIWHTHPGGMVGPSDLDVRHAHVGLKYIVLSLPGGEIRSFSSEGENTVVTEWET